MTKKVIGLINGMFLFGLFFMLTGCVSVSDISTKMYSI